MHCEIPCMSASRLCPNSVGQDRTGREGVAEGLVLRPVAHGLRSMLVFKLLSNF